MRDFIVIGLAIAVLFILVRVIWRSPLVTGVREHFADAASSAVHMMNSSTECPQGSKMYMYEGKAYCCSGVVNVDADTAQQSCRAWTPTPGAPTGLTFCSLGPTAGGIKNCLETRGGEMQAKGELYCPVNMPNYVTGPPLPGVAGRCCVSPADAQFQECQDTTQAHCDVTTAENIFTQPNSCQFQRLSSTITCPTNFSPATIPGQNTFQGISLLGCSDGGTICYTSDILAKLKKLGYDTSSLTQCPTS
jgi:hypothetical protein